jgi:hypothetical protein
LTKPGARSLKATDVMQSPCFVSLSGGVDEPVMLLTATGQTALHAPSGAFVREGSEGIRHLGSTGVSELSFAPGSDIATSAPTTLPVPTPSPVPIECLGGNEMIRFAKTVVWSALIALALIGCTNANQGTEVTSIATTGMRAYCVGRLLVDIPEDFE